METAPLIVTGLLPHNLHRWASALRSSHFPPERNFLDAHVTLFHALPGPYEREVAAALAAEASGSAPAAATLIGVMSLGRGTALRIESPALLELRARLADRFHGLLTAQDSHSPRLHITVQNKVSPAAAKQLQAELAATDSPRTFAFRAFGLHRYLGGPWELVREYPFRG